MAEPFQRMGRWYGRVKDAAGLWRNVPLAEVRTKAQARELQTALALQARRQRDGLEPAPTDRALTVGAILRWWLKTYVAGKSWAGREEDRLRLYFESTELVRLPVVALTAGRLELFLQHWSQQGLAPASVNKLRAMVRTAFNRARRAGLVHGQNPTSDTQPRKVPKRLQRSSSRTRSRACSSSSALRIARSSRPPSTLDCARASCSGWRSATSISSGACSPSAVPTTTRRTKALAKKLFRSRPPWSRTWRKLSAHPRARCSSRALTARSRTEEDKLGKRLRAALGRAGIVDCYLHLCRRCKRNGSPHEEKHADCERRRCPKCGMVLWAKALPRRFRLHDTRHTTATLLLAAGVDLYAVARILRHSDPKITFETYAHLVPGYLHAQIDRLPKLEKFAALVLHEAPKSLEERRGQLLDRPDSAPVRWRAWQESNLRPAASKAAALSS